MGCQIKAESLLFPTMYKSQKVTFPICSGFCGSGSHIWWALNELKFLFECISWCRSYLPAFNTSITAISFSFDLSFCRCVPQLISFLTEQISTDQHALLTQYQGLVQKQLSLARKEGDEKVDDPDMDQVNKELSNLLQQVKDVALVKKRTNSAAEQWGRD